MVIELLQAIGTFLQAIGAFIVKFIMALLLSIPPLTIAYLGFFKGEELQKKHVAALKKDKILSRITPLIRMSENSNGTLQNKIVASFCLVAAVLTFLTCLFSW